MSAYVRQSSPDNTDQAQIARLKAELALLRQVAGRVVDSWAAAEVGEMPGMMAQSVPALRDALKATEGAELLSATQAPQIMGYFTVKQWGECQLSIGKIHAESQALMTIAHHEQVVAGLQVQVAAAEALAATQARRLGWVIEHAELLDNHRGDNLWTIRQLTFDGVGELDTGTKAGDIIAAIDAVLPGERKA